MPTTLGILRLPQELRNAIYANIVATDQPADPLLRALPADSKATTTASSFGLLGTCQQLRAEFLDFFVDHRQYIFEDPLQFANKFLTTIADPRRIESIRHLSLSWPRTKEICNIRPSLPRRYR